MAGRSPHRHLWPATERQTWQTSPVVAAWPARYRAAVAQAYGRFLAFAARHAPADPDRALAAYAATLPGTVRPSTAVTYLQQLGYALLVLKPDPRPGQALLARAGALRSAAKPPRPFRPVTLRGRLAVPVAGWSAADQARWRQALARPGGTLSERFPRRQAGQPAPVAEKCATSHMAAWRWSPAYRVRIERGYGLYLHWSRQAGHGDAPPTPERLTAFVEAWAARPGCRSTVSLASYVHEILMAVRVLRPEADWGWLADDARALSAVATPARDKRARHVPLEDLLAFALAEMAAAAAGPPSVRQAIRYRDGLFLALACLRPKRLRNLARIRAGHELVLTDGVPTALRFATTKNGDPSDTPFPADLVASVAQWWTRLRPVLLRDRPDGGDLWLGRDGLPLRPRQVWVQLTARTRKRFGRPIGPHFIRTCYATAFAQHAPERLGLVSAMLDHRDGRSIRPYQLLAATLAAARALERALEPLRRRPSRPCRFRLASQASASRRKGPPAEA